MLRTVPILALSAGPADNEVWRRLRQRFPEARLTLAGVEIPLGSAGPEEILAACCSAGIPVRGSVVRFDRAEPATG